MKEVGEGGVRDTDQFHCRRTKRKAINTVRAVRSRHSCARVTKSRLYDSRVRDHVVYLSINVSSSAHICGCVVDGGNAVAAI